MISIAYLVSCYPKLSETFILREVRGLRERGFDIRVASINDPDLPPEIQARQDREESASTYYVKKDGLRGAIRAHVATLVTRPHGYMRGLLCALRLGSMDPRQLAYNLFYFLEAVMVGRWMSRSGANHLHVHFATPASTVGMICERIFPITLSITVHGPDEFYEVSRHHLSEKVAAASFVCCIGRYARSQLMKLSQPAHWDKLEVAPLGVDPDLFRPVVRTTNDGTFEVLCVGRLVPAKGQHILLSAVECLVSSGRDVRLRFVGDGPDREGLEARAQRSGIAERIVFEGGVNQDRIRELYGRADVFALASFAEGIPVVLMEAMAMEIPCVTTFITGIPELIRDGVDGLLVAPSDDEGLADALARLMDQPSLRRTLGESGRRRVMDRYHLPQNLDHLAEILRRRVEAEVEGVCAARAPGDLSPTVAARDEILAEA